MLTVITYGTYDLLHHGHIRLLERAKALGDYLIVGVTSDDFDLRRGKINNQQNLIERMAAVEATGLADMVIVEEYEGQKIDDIIKYSVDIFTVGSDWKGKFDYLDNYCDVVYLPRTEGVSSSEIRDKNNIKIGLVGDPESEQTCINKFLREIEYVDGMKPVSFFGPSPLDVLQCYSNYDDFLSSVDAVYIGSHPSQHYDQVLHALQMRKHVLCESPCAFEASKYDVLYKLAKKNNCILMEGIKTAYSTAYDRLLLLIKSGEIGEVVSVDSVCTSLKDFERATTDFTKEWNTITEWGPPALLPVFQILGTSPKQSNIKTRIIDSENRFDVFSKIDFTFDTAVASVRIGKNVKSEGELIVSGTKGYAFVPAPWWKMDYFEIRYENPSNNRRYFYQLDGEGIRYEIVAFRKAILTGVESNHIPVEISRAICSIMEQFYLGEVDYI